ncbi:cytosolic thiouridylase subunit Ctu1 [Saguinus oedipus]|uniref:Cytosolic thiouridylase subunit Ctu1 n=1 Tax=Saguinus oedipus TaxID=9490 RepID=A0ABQ9TX13_SAGOE|nr:cytosolic thiouridylase subunit Ctu1 [Saguinus oedipus]
MALTLRLNMHLLPRLQGTRKSPLCIPETRPNPRNELCLLPRCTRRRPHSGQALYGACFCAAFKAEVQHTVLAGRLLPPSAVVAAVGASGGKDSMVLAHVLPELVLCLGVSLQLVAVDEGIVSYRAVRRQAAGWELPFTILAYEDLFRGLTDAVACSTAGTGRSRYRCTFCGEPRRRALE